MLRKWGLRLLITFGAVVSLFLVFALTLQVPAVGKTMGSPQACGTCHVMKPEVKSLEISAHRDRACLECHSPHGLVEKPVDEIKTAGRHLYVFLTDATPDVIRPSADAKKTIQGNCERCHASTISNTHVSQDESGRYCFDCHRETPHGRIQRRN